jgi:hypothetical protein
LREGELEASVPQPRNRHRLPIERGFSQNGIVAAFVKSNDDCIVSYFDDAPGLNETAVQLFGSSLLVTPQLFAQPTITAVGQDSHGRVQNRH